MLLNLLMTSRFQWFIHCYGQHQGAALSKAIDVTGLTELSNMDCGLWVPPQVCQEYLNMVAMQIWYV